MHQGDAGRNMGDIFWTNRSWKSRWVWEMKEWKPGNWDFADAASNWILIACTWNWGLGGQQLAFKLKWVYHPQASCELRKFLRYHPLHPARKNIASECKEVSKRECTWRWLPLWGTMTFWEFTTLGKGVWVSWRVEEQPSCLSWIRLSEPGSSCGMRPSRWGWKSSYKAGANCQAGLAGPPCGSDRLSLWRVG